MKINFLSILSTTAAIHIAALSATAADYTLPFDLMPSQTVFEDECKVIDVNGDGSGGNGMWKYQASSVAGGLNSFRYNYHSNNNGDDWLMLPMVDFGGTTDVTVSFDVKTDGGSESFEVFLGQGREIEDMTVPVISKTNYKAASYQTLQSTVRVPSGSNKEWCLGFHATSDADQYWIDITNIRIEKATGEVTVIPALPVIKSSSTEYLNYTATVEMPALSVAGDALTDNMTLNVFVDDNIMDTYADLAPGASKSIALTLEEGTHTIGYQAVLNEEAGSMATESVTAVKKQIVPAKPSVSDGAVNGLVYTATVVMPASDTENNPIDGSLTLQVAENETVISTTRGLSAGETTRIELPLSIGNHTLSFTAVLNDVSSVPTVVNVTVEEPVYDLPFTFAASENSFNECVVIDANNDGTLSGEGKWTFSEDAFCYNYNSYKDADDWIILPFVNSGESRKVTISLSAKTGNYPEGFEVYAGNVRTAQGMTEKLAEYTNFQRGEYQVLEIPVDLPASIDAKWAIGIHAISEADQFRLYIKDISVTAAVSESEIPQAPVIVSDNLEDDAYTATVKMPLLSVSEENLDSDMDLKVLVDDELILKKENLAPGEETEVKMTLFEGKHVISFIAVSGNNESEAVTTTVTVKSEEIVTGSLPYTFNVTRDSFDSCLVVDVDKDGVTKNDQTFGMWSYAWLGESEGGALKYTYSSADNAADDWIILPTVDFGEAKGVTVSISVMTQTDEEDFEVYLGQKRTVEAMTLPVITRKNYKHTGTFETLSGAVVLPEETRGADTEWCLGIHASSPANRFLFYVKDIEIKSSVITGVSEIGEDDDAECEYYNLQGLRIENPAAGEIVIVRKGNKTYKKMMR
ncbi:MAG: carbohydrate-binding protein [Bacteroidales bacterium]|nr:carbohydrate-binding protein [Bacteroidales bacterium]